MSELLFQEDPYARNCRATITALRAPLGEIGSGVILEKTVFFARSGGQQGDQGTLEHAGRVLRVQDCVYGQDAANGSKNVVHIIEEHGEEHGAETPELALGDSIDATIDWQRRYAMMRLHTALHLLCSLVPHGVTGGNITAEKARLDFDCAGADISRELLQTKLTSLIADNRAVSARWVDAKMLDENPSLVRTLAAQPPRTGSRVRLIEIEDCDLQPCGGTHVKSTAEIGEVAIGKIENKGRHNRRISLRLVE